jgi:hypothetical protein
MLAIKMSLASHGAHYLMFSPKLMRLAERRVIFNMSVGIFQFLGTFCLFPWTDTVLFT